MLMTLSFLIEGFVVKFSSDQPLCRLLLHFIRLLLPPPFPRHRDQVEYPTGPRGIPLHVKWVTAR